MVLGLSRMQPRSPRPPITPLPSPASYPVQEQDWLAQRGAILFEAACDLIGGFPGFADRGGELPGAALRISERFLLVDETRPHGFGIPVDWLDGAELILEAERDDPDLRVFYSDGDAMRCFSIRFRPNRLAMRGGKRAERAQDALNAAGLIDAAPPEPPSFALPWERTREFDSENVIWTGHASAPVRVGCEPAPSEIWLSTESLIWGSSEGSGLNRVALAELSDVCAARLKDRLGTPTIYLAVSGERFGRYEIPFVFNQQETPDRNFRERGAMLAGLPRAIPDGAPAPLWQPWRLDVHPASRHAEPALESPAPAEAPGVRARIESWLPKLQSLATRGLALPSVEDEEATVVAFTPAEPEPELSLMEALQTPHPEPAAPSVILTQEGSLAAATFVNGSPCRSAPSPSPSPVPGEGSTEGCLTARDFSISVEMTDTGCLRQATPPPALPLCEGGGGRAEPSASPPPQPSPVRGGGSRGSSPLHLADEEPAVVREPVTAAERFETAALGVLADALQVIDIRLETGSLEPLSRSASLSAARDAAFKEIQALGASKTIKKREMRRRIERLTNLYDAGVRLRSVVDLYDRGRLNNPELGHLRSKLVANVELSPVVVPLAAAAGETALIGETLFGV